MQKPFRLPGKDLAKLQIVHLGKIAFNLQFLALVILIASVLSFLVPAVYYLVLICIALVTLFSLFADPTFVSWWSGGETLLKIADTLSHGWKYLVPIVIVLAVASTVCLCFDKNKKHVARIVVSAIVCLIAFLVLAIKLANAGV